MYEVCSKDKLNLLKQVSDFSCWYLFIILKHIKNSDTVLVSQSF